MTRTIHGGHSGSGLYGLHSRMNPLSLLLFRPRPCFIIYLMKHKAHGIYKYTAGWGERRTTGTHTHTTGISQETCEKGPSVDERERADSGGLGQLPSTDEVHGSCGRGFSSVLQRLMINTGFICSFSSTGSRSGSCLLSFSICLMTAWKF